MTAQVFRSGQSQTFYVTDALAPVPGGGIDGSFRDVTASRFLSVGGEALIASPNPANPTLVIQGAASSTRAGMEVAVVGTGLVGVVKADATTVPPTFTTGSASGRDYVLQSGGAARLRIPSAGFADTPSATTALVVGGTTVGTMAMQSGNYTPVWTTVSGFTSVGFGNGSYIRVGNFVMVAIRFLDVGASLGVNIVNITLPFPPTRAFIGPEATGTCTMGNLATYTLLSGQTGLRQISIELEAQAPFTAPLSATFIYSIA